MSDDDSFRLSRRKALTALGTVGVASAGAGLGTSAYFNDTETLDNNSLTAGQLDLAVDYATDVDQEQNDEEPVTGTVNGNPGAYSYAISDVKPGDQGKLAFCPTIVDNPAWLYVGTKDGLVDKERGKTEPEKDVDDTPGGELSKKIQVRVSYADEVKTNHDGGDNDDDADIKCTNKKKIFRGTLKELFARIEDGYLLDGDRETSGRQPYPASGTHDDQTGPCLCMKWWVPTGVGNVIQTDKVEFDFQFTALQERHNGSPENPFSSSSTSTNSST